MYHGRSKLNSLIACLDATAEVYAKLTGKPAEAFYSDNFAEINIYHKDAFNRAGEIVRGGTRFDALFDGKAIINFAEARDLPLLFTKLPMFMLGCWNACGLRASIRTLKSLPEPMGASAEMNLPISLRA